MFDLILHQVIWTIVSFSMFFALMNKFVLKKISQTLSKRKENLSNLNEQIKMLNSKCCSIKDKISLTQQEFDYNIRFYLEKKLEPMIYDLKLKLEDKSQLLNIAFVKHQPILFYVL